MKKMPTIEDFMEVHKPKFEKNRMIKDNGISFMECIEKKMVQLYYETEMPHAERLVRTNRMVYVYKLYAVLEELYMSIKTSEEYNLYFSNLVDEYLQAKDNQTCIDTDSVFSKHMCIINKLFNKYIEDKYNIFEIFGITQQDQKRIAGQDAYGCLHFSIVKQEQIHTNSGLYIQPCYNLHVKFDENYLKNKEVKELDNVCDARTFKYFLDNNNSKKFEYYKTLSQDFSSKVNVLKENIQKDILNLMSEEYELTSWYLRI